MKEDKINIILDLDQTLICAEVTEEFNFKKYKQKMLSFDFENMDGYYVVFARPGLQAFLDFLFANFNVSVWTAASKDYALFIIDKFILTKPDRNLDFIFFSYHCDLSKRDKGGLKDLSMLWDAYGLQNYNVHNTLIIDDNVEVKRIQPCNCYMIKAFEFQQEGSENDMELDRLTDKLKYFKGLGGQRPACLNDAL